MDTFDWIMNGTGPRHDAASFVLVVVTCVAAVLVLNFVGRFLLMKVDLYDDDEKADAPMVAPAFVMAGAICFLVIVIPLLGIANGLWAVIFDRWLF